MARKTVPKATERKCSTSRVHQQDQPVEIVVNAQTGQLSLSGALQLSPQDSLLASELSRELSSTLKQANAAKHISVHAILISLLRVYRSASGEYEMDEERQQYVN
jgi:hypothetical protein